MSLEARRRTTAHLKKRRLVVASCREREGGLVVKHDERCRVVVDLLDHWRDFFEEPTPNGNQAVDSDDRQSAEDWSLFSSMAKWPSVMELRRCVEILERAGRGRSGERTPVHYTHLMAYTAYVEWRLVDRPTKRRDHRGRLVDDVERTRVRIVPSWVSARIVESALDIVLGFWNHEVALELPPGMTKGLREFMNPDTGEPSWTEAA
jgi:hypothetical protein